MSTLLLRLAAPMQSWGVDSKFDTRLTEREPTKSGVIGLLGAALGIRRDDAESLKELSALKFGVRVDKEGKLLHDFHTAHSEKSAYVTHRYYLCDAIFLCGIESGDEDFLKRCEYALKHPVYPLFLGRRSCPPNLPIVKGIRRSNLEDSLLNEPFDDNNSNASFRIVIDAEKSDSGVAIAKDIPVSFSSLKREFGYRKYRENIITRDVQTGHDPFAELEVE